jgi:hypothetical protein
MKKAMRPRDTRDRRDNRTPSGETQFASMRAGMRNIALARIANAMMKDSGNPDLPMALMFIRMSRQAFGKVDLNHPAFRALVQRAQGKNDAGFFKAIGRELSEDGPHLMDAASKLEWFLIWYWDGSCKRLGVNSPPLNILNRESLAAVCNHFLKRLDDPHPFTEDAVEKARQRLGLQPAKGKKLHVIQLAGKLKIV